MSSSYKCQWVAKSDPEVTYQAHQSGKDGNSGLSGNIFCAQWPKRYRLRISLDFFGVRVRDEAGKPCCLLIAQRDSFPGGFLGEKWGFHYLKNKDGREIDFFITKQEEPALMIEVKWSDAERSPNFSFFEKYLAGVNKIQIVKELNREKTYPDGTWIRTAQNWLSDIRLE